MSKTPNLLHQGSAEQHEAPPELQHPQPHLYNDRDFIQENASDLNQISLFYEQIVADRIIHSVILLIFLDLILKLARSGNQP